MLKIDGKEMNIVNQYISVGEFTNNGEKGYNVNIQLQFTDNSKSGYISLDVGFEKENDLKLFLIKNIKSRLMMNLFF